MLAQAPAFDLNVYLDETCMENTPKDGPVSYRRQTFFFMTTGCLTVCVYPGLTPAISKQATTYRSEYQRKVIIEARLSVSGTSNIEDKQL